MRKQYKKPILTCYERADLGYYSPANANTNCQADCSASVCSLVATNSGSPCDACDCFDTCGTGIVPAIDCFPGDC